MQAADPVSPFYMICLPLIIIMFPRFKKEIKLVAMYSLLSIIIWYITPHIGGGRFILPYLPAFSILCAGVMSELSHKKIVYRFLISVIIFISIVSIAYRFGANKKYIPVIVGKETKQEFLSNNLNFTFGDFYDTDNYFKNHLKPTDSVLLYGFHNLYYVDFPFIDSSWVKKGETFNYIAVQNTKLPKRFSNWKLVYKNDKTLVKLYNNRNTWQY
jgi:hypothetical protein